jgi:hypothetical protein
MRESARLPVSPTDAEAGPILIACASLLGDRFDAQLLAACCNETYELVERILLEACRNGLLVAQGGDPPAYRFHHALSRAAIRSDLDPPTARILRASIRRVRQERKER